MNHKGPPIVKATLGKRTKNYNMEINHPSKKQASRLERWLSSQERTRLIQRIKYVSEHPYQVTETTCNS